MSILYGHAAYAPTQNSGLRNNFVFVSTTAGVKWIDDTTVQAGSVTYPVGDAPGRIAYVNFVDLVYVNVTSPTCYISVIDPNAGVQTTTFNNALAFDFLYLKFAPELGRLLATQSDGTNLYIRKINPNTNAITSATFSTDAANEFQGGIDYRFGTDRIYVARQGSTNTTQSIRIFNGTTLAFVSSIDISPWVPNDMIYVESVDRIVCAVANFDTNAPAVLYLDPIAGTFSIVPTSTAFSATALIYVPIRAQLLVDCATVLAVTNAKSQVQLGTLPTTQVSLTMAYQSSLQKVYHPRAGSNIIDLIG